MINVIRIGAVAAAAVAGLAGASSAQTPPPVRQIGVLERASTEHLASAATALRMPGGRVLINDVTAHRLVLLDSTLAKAIVVADTTGATGNAYGQQAGILIRYRGDTALFIDPASLSMLVVGPTGKIERVMAVPSSGDYRSRLTSDYLSTPGFDARGRLVYRYGGGEGYAVGGVLGMSKFPGSNDHFFDHPDSSLIFRVDLATRSIDSVDAYKTPRVKVVPVGDPQGFLTALTETNEPLPLVDDWAVLSDGTIAVVRGRDFHVDLLAANDRWTSAPKMPFDWQRLSDEQKLALIDSSYKAETEKFDRRANAMSGAPGRTTPGSTTTGGRGSGGGGAAPAGRQMVPMIMGRAELRDIPDYAPPFRSGAMHPDVDGNVWIRTTTMVKGQPVYDIVNRRGELVDRVQLPAFRTIAGFGTGVVYMAVQDAAGVVHVERARVR
jgi:hypothetical protein